jgi:bifunctional UDP-N-acetylglucosamine pyrophosphorylase/glucosamine-1-phosphate N-acetyltransferase/UDP-N-acetylglucosamine pyrophosphorylase
MTIRQAIILAAGKGTRMNSDLPKVLFQVCGRPMVSFVIETLQSAGIERIIVVVGYKADLVRDALSEYENLVFVEQTEQLGTGHAVMVCRDELAGREGTVLIVTGDSPLLQTDSVASLLAETENSGAAAVIGTLHAENPQGLGRIVRDGNGGFEAIVEEKDATSEQRAITEVSMSTYVFDCRELLHALNRLTNDNQQQEYYITDCPGILKGEGKEVRALPVLKPCEALSVNTVDELTIVEAEMRNQGH